MKQCLVCGKEFMPFRGTVCCGSECQGVRNNQTRKEAKARYLAKPENKALGALYMRERRRSDPSIRERDRAWKANPEYKRKQKEYQEEQRKLGKDWTSNNPEADKETKRLYYQKNKERLDRRNREYNRIHPEYRKRIKANRREQCQIVGPAPKAKIIAERMALFDGCCYCNKKEGMTLEHLIPLAKGGSNDARNLFGACLRCNASKSDREWKEWFRGRAFYSEDREREIEARTIKKVQLCLV